MFLASASNVFQIGAEWAWKDRRGGIALPLHVASLYELLGETTKLLPVLRPEKLEGSQTAKQVGYPYHALRVVRGSPTNTVLVSQTETVRGINEAPTVVEFLGRVVLVDIPTLTVLGAGKVLSSFVRRYLKVS
jgi:hypothetical protein